jgi:hypothetical protein
MSMKDIKDNMEILVIMTVINLAVLWHFISEGKTLHGIGYFMFFYVSVFTIHFFTKKFPPKNEIEVKNPKKELITSTLFAILGLLFLSLNYMSRSNVIPANIFTKIPIGLGSIFFSMPFGLLIYLLLKRYKPMKFGLTTQPIISILLGLIIWTITGLFAYFFNKDGILFVKAYDEIGGVLGIILNGIIGAALFEEFSRFIGRGIK